MTCLWQASPASARDVLDRLGPGADWAYTTVKTMLTRLAEKGAVRETTEGNVGLYQPLVTQRAARRGAVKSLVERAFGGALGAFVHHLVADEKLSPAERAKLRELLDDEAKSS